MMVTRFASKKFDRIETVYENSNLPDQPDIEALNKLLVSMRLKYYDFGG